MIAFWAIIEDTWRQSRQQLVFIVMMGVMVLLSAGLILLPTVGKDAGGDPIVVLIAAPDSKAGLEEFWLAKYKEAVLSELHAEDKLRDPTRKGRELLLQGMKAEQRLMNLKQKGGSDAEIAKATEEYEGLVTKVKEVDQDLKKLQRELGEQAETAVGKRSSNITKLEKGYEMWTSLAAYLVYLVTTVLFLAAAAGYFPDLLAAGAVDLVVSRPIQRVQIFFGKFVGGLALYAAVITGTFFLVFVGLGLRLGVWRIHIFEAIPATLFCVALLWSIVALVGVLSRSTALSLIVGYGYYLLVDSGLYMLQGLLKLSILEEVAWLRTTGDVLRYMLPSFWRLSSSIQAAVISVPVFDAQPILTGAVWMAIALGLSYWRFRSLDF